MLLAQITTSQSHLIKDSYPLGARFGQFVHIGSILKSSLGPLSDSAAAPSISVGFREWPDLAAALSALIPVAERGIHSER